MDRVIVVSSLFDSVSTGHRDRDQNGVQTLRDRRNLHKILERKPEFAVIGWKLAQQRFYEAEADVEIKHWKKRNSDIALHEINQEFGSQWLQLQQANQWADQAQRDKTSLYGELEVMNRFFREHQAKRLPRNLGIHENLLWRSRSSKTSNNSLSCLRLWVNCWSDAKEFSKKQRAALERPTFPVNPLLFRGSEPCLAAILDCRTNTGNNMGTSGNVFEWLPAQEGQNSTLFNKSKNLTFSFKKKTGTRYWRNYGEVGEWNATRTATFVDSCTPLLKWRWTVESYWWNLFLQWCDWLSESPDFGIAPVKISWLYGISMLESQLQNWGMFKISRSSSHNAIDQRIWDSEINWRSHDFAIEYRAKRFHRLRYAWCDDGVCIEKTSRQAWSFPKKSKSRKATWSYVPQILKRKTKLLTWSMSMSVQPELVKRYKDSQICSLCVCRMTTSKISTFDGIKLYYQHVICLQKWSWNDCTSQN